MGGISCRYTFANEDENAMDVEGGGNIRQHIGVEAWDWTLAM